MSQKNLDRLAAALHGVQSILILPHNDPDPDSIASAAALKYLLQAVYGVESTIYYRGIVGRAENKALVDYLGDPLLPLVDSQVDSAEPVALVDTQPGTGNNPFPVSRRALLVLDHHPLRQETADAVFSDIRIDLGATSTILTGYFRAAGITPPTQLATALFYGIKADTLGLSRATSAQDTKAYFYLQRLLDIDALMKIERAQVPATYFRNFALALSSVRVYKGVVIAYLGEMEYPDMTAEIADVLLRLKETRWVICMGEYQEELIMSIRTLNQHGAGALARQIVGERGSAGGHGSMAGGHMRLHPGEDAAHLAEHLRMQVFDALAIPQNTRGIKII